MRMRHSASKGEPLALRAPLTSFSLFMTTQILEPMQRSMSSRGKRRPAIAPAADTGAAAADAAGAAIVFTDGSAH